MSKLAPLFLIAFFSLITTAVVHAAGPTTVGLGTTSSFAVLAGSGITNTGTTTINGDVGTYPTATETGFGSVVLTGTNHNGDAVTQGAKTDLVTAYSDAAGRTPATTIPTELGGSTLVPGVYTSAAGTFGITGTLTLNAQGDPNSVFIFQMASTLTTASASNIVLIGSAQSCNIFWQVGSSATLGTGSTLRGNVFALTSITATTGAVIDGRLLARNGAVTLDTNTITKSTCAAATTTTTTTTTTTPTSTASGTPKLPNTGHGPTPPVSPVAALGLVLIASFLASRFNHINQASAKQSASRH